MEFSLSPSSFIIFFLGGGGGQGVGQAGVGHREGGSKLGRWF